MGDRSPIILTERKKRRLAAKAKEEMKAQLDSEKSVDALDTLVSGDNNNNNNNNNNKDNQESSKSFFLENKVVVNFDFRHGAKKSGQSGHPFRSYGYLWI